MNRKSFLKNSLLLAVGSVIAPTALLANQDKIILLTGVIKDKTFHIKSDEYVNITDANISDCRFIVEMNGRSDKRKTFKVYGKKTCYVTDCHFHFRGPYQTKQIKLF